jgi:hypothetical protein
VWLIHLLPGTFHKLGHLSTPVWKGPQGHSAAGRIRSTEKSNDLIGNRTRDLPACSIVPQPTTLPRANSKIVPRIIHHSFLPNPSRFIYSTPCKLSGCCQCRERACMKETLSTDSFAPGGCWTGGSKNSAFAPFGPRVSRWANPLLKCKLFIQNRLNPECYLLSLFLRIDISYRVKFISRESWKMSVFVVICSVK